MRQNINNASRDKNRGREVRRQKARQKDTLWVGSEGTPNEIASARRWTTCQCHFCQSLIPV